MMCQAGVPSTSIAEWQQGQYQAPAMWCGVILVCRLARCIAGLCMMLSWKVSNSSRAAKVITLGAVHGPAPPEHQSRRLGADMSVTAGAVVTTLNGTTCTSLT
jgi:hypothetical protein